MCGPTCLVKSKSTPWNTCTKSNAHDASYSLESTDICTADSHWICLHYNTVGVRERCAHVCTYMSHGFKIMHACTNIQHRMTNEAHHTMGGKPSRTRKWHTVVQTCALRYEIHSIWESTATWTAIRWYFTNVIQKSHLVAVPIDIKSKVYQSL